MSYLKADPKLVLREEFDDWAVLFDPDTGNTYALNPVAVIIWKHLTGDHSEEDLLRLVEEKVDDLPAEAPEEIRAFLASLQSLGLAKDLERESP